jgi:phosphatidylglycerol:prolipoprotein diacylglycerol transferase
VLLFIVLRIAIGRGALRHPGLVAGLFGIGYGVARSVSELLREPDGYVLGPITAGMALSIPLIVIGAALVANSLRTPKAA